ncbi:hypothetical protein MIND_00633400 [Mycena indigotica]|uniref:Uncharacterized protein n=1 Tax=Mycena indigotica TaxID=2126181 RepID=A0A8H6W3X4_9AGAR|nr:uncharacterized protein MIND_00633400 [Mycena indigotica]KAF7304022.1 hypothetical protein MIND_00633400 [Mycena indigotica]
MNSQQLPVPKTTHALKSEQRTRLIRSTRKMEAVLGETPFFVDSSPRSSLLSAPSQLQSTTETRRARAAYIYTPTPRRSSLENLEEEGGPAAYSRPVLAVRLPPSSGSYRSHAPNDSIESPLMSAASMSTTFSFSIPFTPGHESKRSSGSVSSASSMTAAAAIRRARTRKLAKVTRTLGERVPQELVFPTTSNAKRRSRRQSLLAQSATNAVMPTRRTTVLRHASQRRRIDEAMARQGAEGDIASVYSTLSGADWVVASSLRTLSNAPIHSSTQPEPIAYSNASPPPARTPSVSSPANPSSLSRSNSNGQLYRRSGLPPNPRVSIPPTPVPTSRVSMSPSSASPVRSPSQSQPRRSASIRSQGPGLGRSRSGSAGSLGGFNPSRVPSSSGAELPPPLPSNAPFPFDSSAPYTPVSRAPSTRRGVPIMTKESPILPSPSSSFSPTSSIPSNTPLPPPPGLGFDGRGTHRTEKGWSGEWITEDGSGRGMESMNDVARKLREMRIK